MLDFGFSEILLTSAIALVVLGPERLPKVARQVGNWMGRARAMARQLTEQLEREVSADELLKAQSTAKPAIPHRMTSPHEGTLPPPFEPAAAELPSAEIAASEVAPPAALPPPIAGPHAAADIDPSNPLNG